MRVLHIDTEMTWRGGENQLRHLLEGLATTDVECLVAVRPGSAAEERLRTLAQVVPVPMRGGFDPRAARQLKALCERHAVDVIDAHTSNAHSLALLTKVLGAKAKLVVHRRVDYAPSRNVVNRMKYLSPKVDRYVAISDAIKRVLLSYGVPEARLSVVKSAVRTEHYKDAARPAARAALANAYGIDPKLTFLGNASALTPQKGYETLLDAASVLKRQGVPFHLFIAGDGELRDPLERRRIDLGLDNHVTFMGFIQDVPTFLAGLDVLTVPSNFEGLGTILLDGTAAGLPIAATRVGGIPEVISHEQTGLLSEVGDADGLAVNLARLVADPELGRRLNAAARERVARDFSVGAMVGGNLAVYRELVGR